LINNTQDAIDSVNGEVGVVVIDAGDIDIVDTGGFILATNVEGALAENRPLINANTAKVSATEANVIAALDNASIPTATVVVGDKVLVQDTSDTNALKTVTAESISVLMNPILTKSLTVERPSASEDISMFYTPVAITVTEMVGSIGAATSVAWTLKHHTDRSNAGNAVVTAGSTTSSATNGLTTGDLVTVFNDATIPATSFVWLETTAIVGSPSYFSLSVEFTEG
jgi:hypothetical protein